MVFRILVNVYGNQLLVGDNLLALVRLQEIKPGFYQFAVGALGIDLNKGALSHIGTVGNILLSGFYAVYRHSLDFIIDRSRDTYADGGRIRGNLGNHNTSFLNLSSVSAFLILAETEDAFKAVSGTGAFLASDHSDRGVIAAYLAPIGDLSRKNFFNLLRGQSVYRVFRVNRDGDAIQRNGDLGELSVGILTVSSFLLDKSPIKAVPSLTAVTAEPEPVFAFSTVTPSYFAIKAWPSALHTAVMEVEPFSVKVPERPA